MPKIFVRLARAAVATMAVVVVVAPAGCTGDADHRAERDENRAPAPAGGGVTVVSAEVQAMAPQAPPFPEDVKAAVNATLDTYLAKGVVGPLRNGKAPASGLDRVFTDAALGRLASGGPDRAALLEEGSPLRGEVRQDRADAALTALTAPGGEVVLVTARLDLAHTVKTNKASVAVVRSGEVVLVPANGWHIESYDMRTARDTLSPGAR